jgi:hypothetical protein
MFCCARHKFLLLGCYDLPNSGGHCACNLLSRGTGCNKVKLGGEHLQAEQGPLLGQWRITTREENYKVIEKPAVPADEERDHSGYLARSGDPQSDM